MYTKCLGNWSNLIIGIDAFTTMFSTTLTTLDASPRNMARTTESFYGSFSKHNYLLWMIVLIAGTVSIFLFLGSEMGLLIQVATIISFLTATFYAILNYKLIISKHT
ncbi:MAG: hypothetical protein ABI263_01570 [Gelidibacter sp.]